MGALMKKSIFAMIGLAAVCGYAVADEAPEASFELDSLTRKFTKKKEGGMMWSGDAPITIKLRVAAADSADVVAVEEDKLSLTDASGKELKAEFSQRALGMEADGSMLVELYSQDSPKGSWVAVKGDLLVTTSAGTKTHPAKKVSKGKETKVDFADGSVTYTVTEEGELDIVIKGTSAIEQIADFAFTSASGQEVEPNGQGAFTTDSMSNATFYFDEPVTEMNVAIVTNEGLKKITLPMNFRVGMSGMLSAEPKKADSTKTSKTKGTTKRKKR